MSTLHTSLLLVRHGETPWNAAGRWQGHADPPLSERGRMQAEEVAAALLRNEARREGTRATAAASTFTGVVCSDLRRARQTAEILAAALALDTIVDARIRELDIGAWTGLTRAEIEARDAAGLRAFESGEPTVRPGGGECRIEIRLRARDFVRDLTKRHAGQRLLVVTHLGVIRALLPGAEPRHLERFEAVAEELAERSVDPVRRVETQSL